MEDNRDFGIVLWGATGAAGQRVAHHIARRLADKPLRWAIGGRNQAKLEAVRAALPGTGTQVPILIGDSHDREYLDGMAARSRVVVSTVGPFARHGTALLEACADKGTHYCDLTGETHWMRAMIDAQQANARRSGARIVHACGHDSIPSDLGVQFLQNVAVDRIGAPCNRVTTRITKMKGGFSGGTAATFAHAMELRERDPDFGSLSADPYALCPEGERDGPDGPDLMMPISTTYDPHLKAWTKPYFMAPMNSKVVRRTNAIMNYPYGRDFSYTETAATKGGIGGWCAAMGYALFARTFLIAMAMPSTRRYLQRNILPKSGEGPSAEMRETGFYELMVVGETPDGRILKMCIQGQGDPAIESTSQMLAEATLCLAEDGAKISVGGGFWTPASAFGGLLLDRITAHAGMSFDMVDGRL